jgi:hypothetical protein
LGGYGDAGIELEIGETAVALEEGYAGLLEDEE